MLTKQQLGLRLAIGLTLAAAASMVACGRADSLTAPKPRRACDPPGIPVRYYVDVATGADTNPGTAALPFRSIQQAANTVKPADTVIVRDGIYTGGSDAIVDIEHCGTPGNVIVIMAEHQWGAVLDGQNNTTPTGVKLGASYVRVQGFEIRGVSRYGFDMPAGAVHHLEIAGNHIHDVGRYCTDQSGGISAMSIGDDDILVEQNLIHDIGRFSPGENGCNPSSDNWQNHDHGLYIAGGSNILVRNNIFYNLTHGWAIHRFSNDGNPVDSLFLLNNTFAFPNPNKVGQIIISTATSHLAIENNIFYQPLGAGIQFSASVSEVTVSNNLATGSLSAAAPLGIALTGNLENLDPLFVNALGFDFHLQAASPAIGAGLVLQNVPNDFAGAPRPQTNATDIGAYQF